MKFGYKRNDLVASQVGYDIFIASGIPGTACPTLLQDAHMDLSTITRNVIA